MKRVLITGVNGFLGRNIALHFLQRQYSVNSLSMHTNHIADIQERINFYFCDLNNKEEVEYVLANTRPEIVIHCAWGGGNSYAQTNAPIQLKNLEGLETLLTAMDGYHATYFVGLGSAAEYGNKDTPISDDEYENPVNLYGACKKMSKDYSKVFCKIRGMRWLWLRPFYTYGPHDVTTRLLPKVVEACIEKKELTLNSCNSQTDYLYIDDFTSAISTLIERGESGVFNLCSGNSYLMKDIIALICKETGHDKITFDSSLDRPGFPLKLVGKNDKLKSLGWSPTVSIEDGIKRIINASK